MRSVVITGVSRGLGAALFDEAHRRGDRVLGLGRTWTSAQRELAWTRPDRIRLREVDLREPASQPDEAELRDFFGDDTDECVLILNAAVVGPIGSIGALPAEALAAAFAVNLAAPAVLTNAFLAAAPDGPRRVQFVSSSAAQRVIDGWSAYCASKAGAEMFFRVVAEQYADDPSVTVECVDPGQMATGMQEEIRRAIFPQRQQWQESYEQGRLQDTSAVAARLMATRE
jgi:NAD(P)-dependent dehydrogenase (short-subunit alcohol dehydrogenase family)